MGIFGKRKDEREKNKILFPERIEPKPIESVPVLSEPQEPQQAQFAPLFVKVERYHDILNSMHELKSTLDSLKGVLMNLNKIENMKEKNMQNLHEVVGNLSNSMESLDSQFLRPPNFHPESPQQTNEVEQLDDVLHDLKIQVGKLKGELGEMT